MTGRPSWRELLGVWLASAAAEVLGWILVEDAGIITAGVVVGGGLFVIAPLFVVVYSVIWAWPLAAAGDRVAVSGLFVFAAVVQAVSGWFWVGVETITLTTVVMRLLAVVSPMVFGVCAVSVAWSYQKRSRSSRAALMFAQDGAALTSRSAGRELGSDARDASVSKEVETARRSSV